MIGADSVSICGKAVADTWLTACWMASGALHSPEIAINRITTNPTNQIFILLSKPASQTNAKPG
jgi:hypothetical protein